MTVLIKNARSLACHFRHNYYTLLTARSVVRRNRLTTDRVDGMWRFNPSIHGLIFFIGAFAVLALMSAPAFLGLGARAAENDHGLVYHVWFPPPGPDDPEPPPLTVQDQVRYCGAAEEWSRRIWEVTDGSHLIYRTSRRERVTSGNKDMAISVYPYRTGIFPAFEPISAAIEPKIWRNCSGSYGSRKSLVKLQSQSP